VRDSHLDSGARPGSLRAVTAPAIDPALLRYRNILDLERLPWFEAREGRLVLADRSVGPIFDIHVHLAQTFMPWANPDPHADCGDCVHLLKTDQPLDLDIYVNQNFSAAGLEELESALKKVGAWGGGAGQTHTLPALHRDMHDLGIEGGLLLPIDWPALSSNGRRWLKAVAGGGPVVSFGSVHPMRPGLRAELDRQVKRGARGIKVHPGIQLIHPSHPRALKLYRLCGERKIPVFFHCGPVGIEKEISRVRCLVENYRQALAECPQTTFVLGHSGALEWEEGIALANEYDNVWLDLSCQSASVTQRIIAAVAPERILHGSDWPFYHHGIGIAKVLLATDRPDVRRKILWENARQLLHL
jgi:uncharacterized protein